MPTLPQDPTPRTLHPGAWRADAKDHIKLSKRQKGLVQAMHKPSLCPGHSKKGDPVSDLINLFYGMATHSSLVGAPGNNHLYEDNYGGRKENSSKVVSCRALDAACWVQLWQLPGCLQSMHAVLSAGSLPICRKRAQSHSRSCKQHSTGTGAPCVAVLEHILQLCCTRRQQLNTSLHWKGDAGAAWPQGQSQTATVPLCSVAATGMGHLLLLSRVDNLALLPGLGSCVPGTCCQQVGHVQLILLSLGGDIPARHSIRGSVPAQGSSAGNTGSTQPAGP